MRRLYFWDKETRTFSETPPPRNHNVYGEAPYVIGDTIEKYYHPKAECWTDSRSKLNMLDKTTGTITTDKKLEPDSGYQKELARQRRADMHKCIHSAVAQIDAGTAPMSEETRAKCERSNELVSERLGFDAFNVAGRKNNGKGKKYRRR